MRNLYHDGNPVLMGILTTIWVLQIIWTAYHLVSLILKKDVPVNISRKYLKHIKTIGLFALVFGVSGQLFGLYKAFSIIEQVGDISDSLFISGFKLSMIPTLYGLLIFLFSLFLWFVVDLYISKQTNC